MIEGPLENHANEDRGDQIWRWGGGGERDETWTVYHAMLQALGKRGSTSTPEMTEPLHSHSGALVLAAFA
eukprot:SAG31_NODE_1894_length_6965_cov_26.137198_8_plen_70_part_00